MIVEIDEKVFRNKNNSKTKFLNIVFFLTLVLVVVGFVVVVVEPRIVLFVREAAVVVLEAVALANRALEEMNFAKLKNSVKKQLLFQSMKINCITIWLFELHELL